MPSEHTLVQGHAVAEALTTERHPAMAGALHARATDATATDAPALPDELTTAPEVEVVMRDFLVGGACATLLMIAAGALLWRSCATRDAWTGTSAWVLFTASIASFTFARVTGLRRLESFLADHGIPRVRAREHARELLATTLPK